MTTQLQREHQFRYLDRDRRRSFCARCHAREGAGDRRDGNTFFTEGEGPRRDFRQRFEGAEAGKAETKDRAFLCNHAAKTEGVAGQFFRRDGRSDVGPRYQRRCPYEIHLCTRR